jgi:DNA-binding GntR family transcriptional regulator
MVLQMLGQNREPGSIDGALGSLHLKRASTAEHVAEALRDMILRGELQQGQPLREVSLAVSIGVSRNTMREAIRTLAREGIVTQQLHHGALVTRLTAQDVEDIFRVRRFLELAALRAALGAEPEQLAGLAEAVRAFEGAVDGGDWGAVIDADELFHERLVGLLDSPRLSRFFDTIQTEVRLCMSIVGRLSADPAALVAEHQELLDLILRREIDRVTDVLAGHLADAEETIKSVLREEA